jgi:hypothetical protein
MTPIRILIVNFVSDKDFDKELGISISILLVISDFGLNIITFFVIGAWS